MTCLHITDLEAAINHWRDRQPADPHFGLPAEVRALAETYAQMVWQRRAEIPVQELPPAAHAAWLAWYDTTPDTPCIAICSTSQGDDLCKGCGRTFAEVQHWPQMSPTAKRAVWRRITQENTAWRFNTYAERAVEKKPPQSRGG